MVELALAYNDRAQSLGKPSNIFTFIEKNVTETFDSNEFFGYLWTLVTAARFILLPVTTFKKSFYKSLSIQA